MMTQAQASRRLSAGTRGSRVALRVVLRDPSPVAPAGARFGALARDLAGGALLVGSWVALWAWFLAATW